MKTKPFEALQLVLSSARGRYIPRDFVTGSNGPEEIDTEHCQNWGLTDANREQWKDALNPEHEWYWEAWGWILNNAKFTDTDGNEYLLRQDGDLWAYCAERMTDEEKANFFGEY